MFQVSLEEDSFIQNVVREMNEMKMLKMKKVLEEEDENVRCWVMYRPPDNITEFFIIWGLILV